jgi:hypothetical protein
MTSNQHGPYVQGYTRATMVGTKGCDTARWSQSQKTGLSSDCSLQLDCMKVESLVIADQHAAVNTFPGLVHTARQAMEAGGTRSRYPNLPLGGRGAPKVKPVTGAKSKQGSRIGRCGWITSFLRSHGLGPRVHTPAPKINPSDGGFWSSGRRSLGLDGQARERYSAGGRETCSLPPFFVYWRTDLAEYWAAGLASFQGSVAPALHYSRLASWAYSSAAVRASA